MHVESFLRPLCLKEMLRRRVFSHPLSDCACQHAYVRVVLYICIHFVFRVASQGLICIRVSIACFRSLAVVDLVVQLIAASFGQSDALSMPSIVESMPLVHALFLLEHYMCSIP
jgi:hypothetical protein